MNAPSSMLIRTYEEADAAATQEVFVLAITVTAAADYTAAQIEAWAQPHVRDLGEWNASMNSRRSFVADIGGEVAGFSDVDHDGYIDMMFVSPVHQRRGIASALLEHAENEARTHGASSLSANVSITARPFFEEKGFVVQAEQCPIIRGAQLINFKMGKSLE